MCVVVVVMPWDTLMLLSVPKHDPAPAASYTVILKASEQAPCATLEFTRLVGVPDGGVSVVAGDAENCAIPLTSYSDVDRITFTGDPETARHVVCNSAENSRHERNCAVSRR